VPGLSPGWPAPTRSLNQLTYAQFHYPFSPSQRYKSTASFFFANIHIHKKKGYPGKQGLIAIKQDLWWLGVINHAGTTKKRYRRTDDGMNGIRHSGLSTISKVDEEFANPITATPPAPLK
jgi:hypothetical protein